MPSGRLLLGAIADDFTGGSDLAGMLASQGVGTVQTFGVPDSQTLANVRHAEALVISLKSRSVAPDLAVSMSLDALACLRQLGTAQIQFKYCSTFDSTERGNIGPVASALMTALEVPFTIAVPALPVNGRTQYRGYLFVHGVPLAESPMRHHPLNPMTDSNLMRHLQAQTERQVGLIDWHRLQDEASIPRTAEIALVDALTTADLRRIAERLAASLPLITGGSGIGNALPPVWRERNAWQPSAGSWSATAPGRALLLAGSCSAATLAQIERWRAVGGHTEAMRVDALSRAEVDRLLGIWNATDEPLLIYSSAAAGERRGDPRAVEAAFGELASQLRGGYQVLIVAGGETAGAVVEALGIRAVEIGPEIESGVPALRTPGDDPLRMTLKSGNFGSPDFFVKACRALNATS